MRWSSSGKAEEIIARLAEADPDDLDVQVNLLKTQRELGNVSMYQAGRHRGGPEILSPGRRDRPGTAWRRSLTTTRTRVSWPMRWASSRARKWRSAISSRPRELYREELEVRESFSPRPSPTTGKVDVSSRATTPRSRAVIAAGWATWLKPRSLIDQCARSANRLLRNGPIPGRPKMVSR